MEDKPVSRRRLRLVLWICVGGIIVLLLVLALVYQAIRAVPAEYEEVLEIEPKTLREGSDEMLQQASALASNVQRAGKWEAWFSQEQINGWLAVDLVENHPEALPDWAQDPRVKISPEQIYMFCTVKRGGQEAAVTLRVEPYVAEPNVVAFRLRAVRAGLLPLPMGRVTNEITKVARKADIRLRWQQAAGDPVALVHLPEPRNETDKLVEISDVQLGDGRLYVAGKTIEVGEKGR